MAGQLPKDVVQERFERLVALQERISAEENAKLIGTEVELLVQAGGGKKNDSTQRMSGRARDGRLVHFTPRGEIDQEVRPGDVVYVAVTDAKPHYLIADSGVVKHRRTKAGDNSAAGDVPTTAPIGVGLGLPSIGKPGAAPASSGCC